MDLLIKDLETSKYPLVIIKSPYDQRHNGSSRVSDGTTRSKRNDGGQTR